MFTLTIAALIVVKFTVAIIVATFAAKMLPASD